MSETDQNASSERIIIFSRYPTSGTTKTRLIPALGADGAALLQQQMTEHTVRQVKRLRSDLQIDFRFTGGDAAAFRHWLGDEIHYQPQGEGDLGDRLTRSIHAAFVSGAQRVVTLGIDCPELDTAGLQRAFEQLQTHDVMLGPAEDGGYYLIGLRRFVPELFQHINWSTETVLRETVEVAQRLGLAIALLDPLPDVDRPDDLPVWQRVAAQFPPALTAQLSIIIPTLNEAPQIGSLLTQLQQTPGLDIIVADGGSVDDTVEIAHAAGVKVIVVQGGRSQQLNQGAAIAQGEIVLFLHADTQLPNGFSQWVRQTLSDPQVVIGAFELHIESCLPSVRWVERGVHWRSRWLKLPYGDQALFLWRSQFERLGGFRDMPIMEDFELVQRSRQLGTIRIVPAAVTTSGRRWEKLGVWQTTLMNQVMVLGYFLGISPQRLAQWYRKR